MNSQPTTSQTCQHFNNIEDSLYFNLIVKNPNNMSSHKKKVGKLGFMGFPPNQMQINVL